GLETYGEEAGGESGLRLIPLAREINDGMPAHMVALIEEALAEAGRELAGAKVALLGVSYLENADDTRNTPAAVLARLLLARGAQVVAHDPYVRAADWERVLGDGCEVVLTADLDEALQGADCAALVTRHRDYQGLDLERTKSAMRTAALVDGRGVFSVQGLGAAGWVHRCVGQG
ncbi:MAG: nucleotide sugar dehydrogenase, partial [Anaerolineae bacterium]|nr:nucleotide sugar dehydrogenase [Anaerolineae bacterium]